MISFMGNESFLYDEDSKEAFAAYLETEAKRLFLRLTGREVTQQELMKLFEGALAEDSSTGVFFSMFDNGKIHIEVSLYTGKVIFVEFYGIGRILSDGSEDEVLNDLIRKVG